VRHSGDRDSALHGPKHTTRRMRDRRWPDDRLTDDVDCELVDRITRQRFQPRCRSSWLTDRSNHDGCATGRDHQQTIGLTKHLVIQIDANDNTRQLTTPGPPSTSSVTPNDNTRQHTLATRFRRLERDGRHGLKPCHYPRNSSGQEAVAACVWFVPSVCLRFRPEGPFSDSPGRSPGSGVPQKIGV
jgi:hypothetical protein